MFLAGCAGPAEQGFRERLTSEREPVAECARFFHRLDRAAENARVNDAAAARVPGFPYLRVDRFLAANIKPPAESDAFAAWAARLRILDVSARDIEIANLPNTAKPAGVGGEALAASVERCGRLLLALDLAKPDRRLLLAESARVPAAYSTFKRAAGLYPVTSLFFNRGVERLHEDVRRKFAVPRDRLPVEGELIRYHPRAGARRLSTPEVAALLEKYADNPLGIPEPRGEDRASLFETFAPVWEVDVASNADRIGRPGWSNAPRSVVDTSDPVVYRKLTHTYLGSKPLLQLSYVVWFPERPIVGAFDLLGGHLDGITWRVTLGPDGRPLIYDSMHNCGCYHMFFTTDRVRMRARPQRHEEPLLVPQSITGEPVRLAIRVAPRTHYLQRVYADTQGVPGTIVSRTSDYRELRSLPLPGGGRRSLFGTDGLVADSERGERWLFWPMGIAEPGAMRQWGHHATAFVGRRHFDDADLVERYFEVHPTELRDQGRE